MTLFYDIIKNVTECFGVQNIFNTTEYLYTREFDNRDKLDI